MLLILDGSSEHGAHIWSNSGISICWRHFVTSKESSNFFLKRPFLLYMCATCSELPFYISTMNCSIFCKKLANLTELKCANLWRKRRKRVKQQLQNNFDKRKICILLNLRRFQLRGQNIIRPCLSREAQKSVIPLRQVKSVVFLCMIFNKWVNMSNAQIAALQLRIDSYNPKSKKYFQPHWLQTLSIIA